TTWTADHLLRHPSFEGLRKDKPAKDVRLERPASIPPARRWARSKALIDGDGKVRYVIVRVGGFLGLGERDVALRWDQLTMADNDQKIVVNMTKEQLNALPAHRFADASSKGKVYAYDEDLKTNPYLSNDTGVAMAPSSAVDTKKLIGRNIKNPAGDTVGEIESVLVDQPGNVKYVVVGVGGFLGIGEKHIALSWDS